MVGGLGLGWVRGVLRRRGGWMGCQNERRIGGKKDRQDGKATHLVLLAVLFDDASRSQSLTRFKEAH